MNDSYYDVAQICLNGHVINSSAQEYPTSNQDYCSTCGAKTIMKCPNCNESIRGYYNVPGVFGVTDYSAPAYCYNCGNPFPWTVSSLKAASELADELDVLTDDEKCQLRESLPELVKNSPKTAVAEWRFKKIMKKAGKEACDGMKSILTDVLSEVVKKSLFGA